MNYLRLHAWLSFIPIILFFMTFGLHDHTTVKMYIYGGGWFGWCDPNIYTAIGAAIRNFSFIVIFFFHWKLLRRSKVLNKLNLSWENIVFTAFSYFVFLVVSYSVLFLSKTFGTLSDIYYPCLASVEPTPLTTLNDLYWFLAKAIPFFIISWAAYLFLIRRYFRLQGEAPKVAAEKAY